MRAVGPTGEVVSEEGAGAGAKWGLEEVGFVRVAGMARGVRCEEWTRDERWGWVDLGVVVGVGRPGEV